MLRKPWQIWLLFGACLAIVIPAMGWLTWNALDLDLEIQQSRERLRDEQQQAALFEQVSNSLRLMDWRLTPLVAEEAIRPYHDYLSLQPLDTAAAQPGDSKNTGKGKSNPGQSKDPAGKTAGGPAQQRPSPLLLQPASFVRLHFQVTPDGQWSSPQVPPNEMAHQFGLADQVLDERTRLLTQLQEVTRFEQLLAMVPEAMLPKYVAADVGGKTRSGYAYGNTFTATDDSSQVIDLGLNQLKQQVNQAGNEMPSPQGTGNLAVQQESRRQLQGAAQGDPFSGAELAQQEVPRQQQPPREQVRQQRIQQSRQQLWNQRNIGIQNFAINQMAQQRAGGGLSGTSHVTEGVTRPIWIDDHLILARRVIYGSQVIVQGCWLDWEKLREVLLADISGYLRRVKLVPVNDEREVFPERMLATLPVELVVDPQEARELAVNPGQAGVEAAAPSSAIRGSLLIAWCCIVLAACSIAAVLQGVVTLSERRGAFVSTVTHELRTPLTTFRMYSEMLATGMVQDEAKKRSYLETLQVEAERLSHLVENVLQYARLERGKRGTQREAVDVRDLWQRVVSRLTDRAQQVEMQLVADFSVDAEDAVMRTDPAAVEQILFNLVDNACKYARSVADATIEVNWLIRDAHVEIRVTDRGPGIPPEKVRHLFRPFSKSVHDPANTAPGVGLGLALCRQLAQALGGQLRYESPGGQGATFVLTVPLQKD